MYADVKTEGVITVEVLLSGSTSQIVALPAKYRFSSTVARNAYFNAYPDEQVERMWILVEDVLYQFINGDWVSMSTVVTGPPGSPFTVMGELTSTDELPDPSFAPANEVYLVEVDGRNHLFVLINGEWSDQGLFTSVPGPQGLKGDKGDKGDTPTFEIRDGHLYAIYEGDE